MNQSMPIILPGVSALTDHFDAFLVDQYGVLHEGDGPYPGVVDALLRLRKAGKVVVLLSNSGKRAAANAERLLRLGFPAGCYDHFLTSGEVAWHKIRENRLHSPLPPEPKAYLLSRDGDTAAVAGLPVHLVPEPALADVVLLTASTADTVPFDQLVEALRPAAGKGTPCLCTNPDKTMLTPMGPFPGAGALAEAYERMGGPVEWIGKPHAETYRAARALLGDTPPERIACVGDSLEHDIAGGFNAGLTTVAVQSGLLEGKTGSELAALYEQFQARPDFVLPRFTW